MVTAERGYTRGEAQLSAQIITGPIAQGALASAATGMKIETSEGRMSTAPVDRPAGDAHLPDQRQIGAIIVALSNAAIFTLTFNGVDEDEALTLAKAFNWKGDPDGAGEVAGRCGGRVGWVERSETHNAWATVQSPTSRRNRTRRAVPRPAWSCRGDGCDRFG